MARGFGSSASGKACMCKEKNSKTIECPECGCKDGNHAQECSIYYNVGYGKKK